MLTNLADFESALETHLSDLAPGLGLGLRTPGAVVIGSMHCTGCGDSRRMAAMLLYPTPVRISVSYKISNEPIILCTLDCVQCSTRHAALKHEGPNSSDLVVLSNSYGGLSTPHTPASVAYYLEQAHRSRTIGANSAALAMFRAALEQLLYQQGFTDGMLDRKIRDLEAGITSGRSPIWARELDTEYLRILKELGNGAIHTNGGDITKQANIDTKLVAAVEATFSGLLLLVYEIPHLKAARLQDMKAKAALLK